MATGAPQAKQAEEKVAYRRSPALPGLEVVEAQNSAREWRVACPSFAVVVFHTWRGQVRLGGRTHAGVPGVAFCNMPGEAMVARPDGDRPGTFDVLEVAPEVFDEWLAERPGRRAPPLWAAVMQPVTRDLAANFGRFFKAFQQTSSALELQSHALELSDSLIGDLIAGAGAQRASDGPPIRGTARMRECLTEEGLDIDLATLASRVGLSRFQALRAFKRRYGLPPHAYQLCIRLDRARRLLCAGAAPVEVAQSCGFVDQSHFSRHFKRAFGVTPLQYARGPEPNRSASSGVYPMCGDVTEIVSRSDHGRP